MNCTRPLTPRPAAREMSRALLQLLRIGALGALVACAGTSMLTATSYVMTTDRELVQRSELVVLANVLSVTSAPDAERPSTDYLIEIERLAKGFVPSSTLVVRAWGGTRDDGLSMKVFGQPTLLEGDRVVLFLDPGTEGTYRFSEMGLSVFFVAEIEGRSYAMRGLSEANFVSRPNDPQSVERSLASQPRRLDEFLDWVGTAQAAPFAAPAPDFYVQAPLSGMAAAQGAFTSLRSSTCGSTSGSPIRWFEFDSATNVRFVADSNGQPGVPGNGLSDLGTAFTTWNQVSNTAISLRYGGTTTTLTPAITLPLDGLNSILFEDPNNEISGSFTGGGGTLAIGTVFFVCGVQTFNQGPAHAILEAGIVFQDGTGANFFGISLAPLAALLEVLTHEVGHAIGFGHSCGDSSSPPCSGAFNDAIMRAFAYDDGRGSRLNSDDRAGARFLYGVATQSDPPAAPSALQAMADSTSQITLNWVDQASDESSYEVEERSVGEDFALIATLAADSTSLVVENIPATTFREYRVRARNSQGASEYSAVAGATTRGTIGQCVDGLEVLCLNNDRYQVTSSFATVSGATGNGQRQEITDDTGYFWFFNDTNVEVVVKVLDGCAINNNYWVFAGGLTDVQVVMVVVDKQTGLAKTYVNPQSTAFQPVQDTSAFATCP